MRSRMSHVALNRCVAVVVLVGLVAMGCSKDEPTAAPGTTAAVTTSESTTTTVAPTTVAPVIPTWPLTGEAGDAAAMNQPVVAVKVDNSPESRPHAGINSADIVYELNVEGITRFMELFHSQSPDRVGPVRSARSSDIDLFGNLNRPLLLWSGGNPGVTAAVLGAQDNGILIDLGHGSGAGREYYRDGTGGKFAPHDLFTNITKIRADFSPPDVRVPLPMFDYRKSGEAISAAAVDAPGMILDFGLGVRVEYVWDAERAGWDRFQVDQQHPRDRSAFVDETGTQIAPQNVVILFLQYGQDEVDGRSPKAYSVGEGDGVVLTEGKAINVHWRRAERSEAWNLTDAATGGPVPLTPGRTWVALPQQGADQALPIDAVGAADLMQYRA